MRGKCDYAEQFSTGRSYINDFHRQNSMGAVKEVKSMLLHPYSREQKLGNQLTAPEDSFKREQQLEDPGEANRRLGQTKKKIGLDYFIQPIFGL